MRYPPLRNTTHSGRSLFSESGRIRAGEARCVRAGSDIGEVPKKRKLGHVLHLAGIVALVALGFALFWFALWSLFNPATLVPAPKHLVLRPVNGGPLGSVLFLGDTAPADAALEVIARRGYDFPYAATRNLLAESDVVVANFESPITSSDNPWPWPKKWVYKAHPDVVPALARAGVDVVILANNHVYDYGRSGLSDTLSQLERGAIHHLGAGMSEAAARRGLVIETAGGRLGLLAYAKDKPSWRLWYANYALDTPLYRFAGAARINTDDLRSDIARLRPLSDVVAVTVHWGDNYQPIDEQQRKLARACVAAGADVVVGHHSHQAQPVGMVNGKPVIYSIGNYAFGTRGHSIMRYGMAARLVLADGELTGIEFVPLLTQNRIVHFQPQIATGERADRFFEWLLPRSAHLGATVQRRGDRGWLQVAPGNL